MMQTERILLRPWRESDAETLYKYASDPEVGPRAGWPPHQSVEESMEIIRTVFHSDHIWAIELRATGEAIGCMGYYTHNESNINIDENDVEAGYWIAKPYWNRGVCTEALRLLIDYCFNVKGFNTIWSDFFVDNPASGRVMEKCGFRDTGEINYCSHLQVGNDRPVKIMRLNRTQLNTKYTEIMEQKFCQSCGMPLTEEILGTNADGSKNEEYCIYCYKDGAFTGDFTMEEMVEFCSQFVDEFNKNTGQNLSREDYKDVLRQFYPSLKRWQLPADQLPHATSPIKQQLIEEVNALGIADMPKIDNLFVLQGSFINQEYRLNGNSLKLLDDNASYWGNQVEKGNGRCYGIACNEHYILVSEYGKDGKDAEIVILKRR